MDWVREKERGAEGVPLSADAGVAPVTVFRGSRAGCDELGLVFEATALPHTVAQDGAEWALNVAPECATRAFEEMQRYAAERSLFAARQRERSGLQERKPFGGATAGAAGYALVLLLVAYGVGDSPFSVDWVAAGALKAPDPGQHLQWWRALTALTLHQSPEHLLSNLVFGIAGGVLCTRLFGYGIGWLGILVSGVLANLVEMSIAPLGYSAIGASTAVFGSVGLLSGYAWRQRLTLRERWLYRWTPLMGGISLLALLGAGGEHVDVLGHLLGFLAGLLLGWGYALAGVPRNRRAAPQNLAAGAGTALIVAAWGAALWAAGAQV
jgi:membrane associated rhomboid family serine protease